jgi:hypothetical protein
VRHRPFDRARASPQYLRTALALACEKADNPDEADRRRPPLTSCFLWVGWGAPRTAPVFTAALAPAAGCP